LLGRWQRIFSATSVMTLQLYYDRTQRREPTFRDTRDTFDVDLQHHFRLPWRQEITWGLGYRLASGETHTIPSIVREPPRRTDQLFSAFIQDEVELVAERLRLLVGSKFEHNDYSDFEFQPSARLLWTPTARQTVWAAVSRAVRTPSRIEHDLTLTTVNP